jgi:hypothetical protein
MTLVGSPDCTYFTCKLRDRLTMKQNITLSLDKRLLKRVRAFAAARGLSVSGMLSQELQQLIEREAAYDQTKRKAFAHLDAPFHLGGNCISSRESLHER